MKIKEKENVWFNSQINLNYKRGKEYAGRKSVKCLKQNDNRE